MNKLRLVPVRKYNDSTLARYVSSHDRYSKPDVLIRKATLEDKDAIIAIDKNIYNGLDYLPEQYTRYVTDPNFILLVLEMDKQIVCCGGSRILPCRTTGVGIAGRTIATHQDKGLFHLLVRGIFDELKKKYPSVTAMNGTRSYSKHDLERMEQNSSLYPFAFRQCVSEFSSNAGRLSQLSQLENISKNVKKLSLDEALHLANDFHSISDVFKNPVFLAYEHVGPIPLLKENLLDCLATHNVVVTSNDEQKVISMSLGIKCRVPLGLRVNIFYNSRHQNSLTDPSDHVLKQLQTLSENELPNTNIALVFFHDDTTDRTVLKTSLENYVDMLPKDKTIFHEFSSIFRYNFKSRL